jgi:cyclic pyranopterin phosphate synthase
MPEEGVPLRDKKEFMTSEEVVDIAKTFVSMGVKKIRLTGGEPLIKKDAPNIIRQLGKLPVELAITTNAVLVHRFIDIFKEAGIKSVNVSLDSLQAGRFNMISRRSFYQQIFQNIELLLAHDFHVKINVVVIKGINDDEIVDFVKWTRHKKVHVRFIEFMPFDGNQWNWKKKVSYREILNIVGKAFDEDHIIKIADKKNDTARNYRLVNSQGTFGIISSVTNPFCDSCNRIRLTADGKIKNCLFSQSETDLLSSLRAGEELAPAIYEAILHKKKERGGRQTFEKLDLKTIKNRSMVAIGG